MKTEIKKIEELEKRELTTEKRRELVKKIGLYLLSKTNCDSLDIMTVLNNHWYSDTITITREGDIVRLDGGYVSEDWDTQIEHSKPVNVTSSRLPVFIRHFQEEAERIIQIKNAAIEADSKLIDICNILN